MSAPNFNISHNTRHLCAFCDYSDFVEYCKENAEINDSTSEELENDSIFYQDWYENEKDYYFAWIKEELEKRFNYVISFDASEVYDGKNIAEVNTDFDFAGVNIEVNFGIVFEAGYYGGFKLDWCIDHIEQDAFSYPNYLDNDFISEKDCEDFLYWNSDKSKGLSIMLAGKLKNRLENHINEIGKQLSDVLETVAPYCLEGHVMSNGEGIYFPVEKTA